ncbi:hypothetical protein UFOVP130_24 [uncultured Caudovirales phage]|uniref:Uncharacterized protein n=1 Tax=uncultured Caudovirales phage TaxID=2100421 RepID=A0A6J5L827_9CAUD|nr:hypothetical protein UFOVP130_24 [uncultured Caudovirales phage]
MRLYPKTDSSRIREAGEGGGIIAGYSLLTADGTLVEEREIYVPSTRANMLRDAIRADVGTAALAIAGGDAVAAVRAAVDGMTDAEWRNLGV